MTMQPPTCIIVNMAVHMPNIRYEVGEFCLSSSFQVESRYMYDRKPCKAIRSPSNIGITVNTLVWISASDSCNLVLRTVPRIAIIKSRSESKI